MSSGTLSHKSFLRSLLEAFGERLNNQAIAGSLALAGASLLSRLAWAALQAASARVKERLFSVYIIPKNTAQYAYFMAWLKDQPGVATGVMQVNSGTRASATNSGILTRQSRYPRPPSSMGSPFHPSNLSTVQPVDGHADQTQDFSMVPALGSVLNMRFMGSHMWINTGIASGSTDSSDGNSSFDIFPSYGGRGGLGSRSEKSNSPESLATITTFGSNEELVLEVLRRGKALMAKNAHVTTTIFVAKLRQGPEWQLIAERPARKMSSIVLPGDTATAIAKDCSDFVTAEDWYADRGIPYRRGYLLHGKPGCGKTSLVTALAGELKLPIYMLSLATPGLSDSSLLDLLNQTPPHMILLLEDIDAVFDVALKNDEKNRKAKAKAASQEDEEEVDEGRREAVGFGARGPQRTFVSKRQMVGKINISFAGILNAVDGVAAQTGRLLFMTTNHKEKLDTALIRPGRIDYQVQFREANREQIKALFFNFYKPLEHASDEEEMETAKQKLHRLEARVKEEQNLALLGEQFAARVPEGKYTMAQVQGVFMRHRRDPKEMLACLADELDLMDEGEPNEVPSLSRQLSGKKVD